MEAMGRGADKTWQWVSTLHSSASYNLPRMYLLSKTSLGSGSKARHGGKLSICLNFTGMKEEQEAEL